MTEGATVAFDNAVVVKMHVRWQLLSTAEQVELVTNYPINPPATVPGPTTFGDDVDPRFEAWLDSAYQLRHVFDNIAEDPGF